MMRCCKDKLLEKCPYSNFFRPVFSLIRTEYGDIKSVSQYSVQLWENMNQQKHKYGHFSRSAKHKGFYTFAEKWFLVYLLLLFRISHSQVTLGQYFRR